MGLDGINGANSPQTMVNPAGSKEKGNTKTVKAESYKDLGCIEFSEGLLKDIEVKDERYKNSEGIFQTYKVYKAALSDGTTVTYDKQPDGGSGGIDSNTAPRILQNKDCSIDFIGLNLATISDSPKDDSYNLIGCSFTDVFLNTNGEDKDKVDFANIKDSNGNIVQNNYNTVFFDAGDKVGSPINVSELPQVQKYSGYISSQSDSMEKVENVNPDTSLERHSITGPKGTGVYYTGGTFFERIKANVKDLLNLE